MRRTRLLVIVVLVVLVATVARCIDGGDGTTSGSAMNDSTAGDTWPASRRQ